MMENKVTPVPFDCNVYDVYASDPWGNMHYDHSVLMQDEGKESAILEYFHESDDDSYTITEEGNIMYVYSEQTNKKVYCVELRDGNPM